MRVHPSNYRIVGFTALPSIADLSALAHSAGLPLYEDAGSGVLHDLSNLGLADEPVIAESLASGADVVSFSGDKLLGAGQAGLVVGRADIISRLRSHALYRALRADKLSLSVLEATLESHRRGVANDEVPVLRMIAQTAAEIAQRANDFIEAFRHSGQSTLELATVEGISAIGGGSGPSTHPPTVLLALNDTRRSPDELAQDLRSGLPPVITRIADDRVLLDLRTVDPSEEQELLSALVRIAR
jgi:L-seryl-tRNA(Ser) seleniumtransferase